MVTRQHRLRAAILTACIGAAALTATSVVSAPKEPERMPATAGQTEYDRTANTRVDVWERAKENASEEPRSLNDLDTEIGGQTIGISEDDSARAADLYERLVQDKENTEFGDFLKDLDHYDEVLEDPEGDYTKLAPRISRLENMDYNWEPAGASYSSWKLISVTELGSWEPATGTQTTNFTQTRDRLLDYQRLVEKEERNIATQEVRVASSTYETDPRTDTISRNINVALGGWTNTGGLHSCTTWSPATSTKPKGTSFTQTRTCKQNQARNVSYTVASTGENPGGAWTDSQILSLPESRPATGTKITNISLIATSPHLGTYDLGDNTCRQKLANKAGVPTSSIELTKPTKPLQYRVQAAGWYCGGIGSTKKTCNVIEGSTTQSAGTGLRIEMTAGPVEDWKYTSGWTGGAVKKNPGDNYAAIRFGPGIQVGGTPYFDYYTYLESQKTWTNLMFANNALHPLLPAVKITKYQCEGKVK